MSLRGNHLIRIIYVKKMDAPMVGRSLKDFLVGTLVGIMSMMPGASGGIIAVVFGIYERLIADLADIRGRLFKDLRFIIPVGIGIVVGLLVCAIGIDALLQNWEVPMMFFFAALILYQMPDIRDMANGEGDGRPKTWNIAACIVGFLVMVAFLFIGSTDSDISLIEFDMVDIVLLFVVGVVIALSKIVPGLSGAAILLAIGLYTPLMDLVGGLDMSVILERAVALVPIALGVVIGAIGLAKVVNHFMTNNRRSTYYCILGMTAGSVVTVTVQAIQGLDGMTMAAASIVGVLIGLAFGYVLRKVSVKYARETISTEPGSTGDL